MLTKNGSAEEARLTILRYRPTYFSYYKSIFHSIKISYEGSEKTKASLKLDRFMIVMMLLHEPISLLWWDLRALLEVIVELSLCDFVIDIFIRLLTKGVHLLGPCHSIPCEFALLIECKF